MGGHSFRSDTVGMSEAIGVAVLVGLTITVTAMVGLNVLVFAPADDSAGPQANFTFDYVEQNSVLIVTHAGGDELEAGNLEIHGPENTVTWAEVANRNESELVGPGDITQLSGDNPYGSGVLRGDNVTVYLNRDGNRTRLEQWDGG